MPKPRWRQRFQLQGADDSQDTAGGDAGTESAATTAPADEPAADPQRPADVAPLTKGALDTIPRTKDVTKAVKRWVSPWIGDDAEDAAKPDKCWVSPTTVDGRDDDGWTRLSDESHEDAETVETARLAARSVFSRIFFGMQS